MKKRLAVRAVFLQDLFAKVNLPKANQDASKQIARTRNIVSLLARVMTMYFIVEFMLLST
jgi:hypothetical protein